MVSSKEEKTAYPVRSNNHAASKRISKTIRNRSSTRAISKEAGQRVQIFSLNVIPKTKPGFFRTHIAPIDSGAFFSQKRFSFAPGTHVRSELNRSATN
jgi:hypothetical protein